MVDNSQLISKILLSPRMARFKETGLLGCFDGTGVNSENYKDFILNNKKITAIDPSQIYDRGTIIYPEGVTEKQKELIDRFIRNKERELTSITVIYNPDCGCKIDQFVLLDRYPMSQKIRSQCPQCKKGCVMEISNPIVFHTEIPDQDFEIEDIPDLLIYNSWQSEFLLEYLFS